MRTRFFVWALLLIVGLSLAPAVPAAAQGSSIGVATVEDLMNAIANPAYSTIYLHAGTYSLSSALGIGRPLTLRGQGVDVTIIQRDPAVAINVGFPLLQVAVDGGIEVHNLTLRNAINYDYGGAIATTFVARRIHLFDSKLENNYSFYRGGAIYWRTLIDETQMLNVRLERSIVVGNDAYVGGAVYIDGYEEGSDLPFPIPFSASCTLFTDNTAQFTGGAVGLEGGGYHEGSGIASSALLNNDGGPSAVAVDDIVGFTPSGVLFDATGNYWQGGSDPRQATPPTVVNVNADFYLNDNPIAPYSAYVNDATPANLAALYNPDNFPPNSDCAMQPPLEIPGNRDVAPEAVLFHENWQEFGLPLPFERLPYNIVQLGQTPDDPLGVSATRPLNNQGFGTSTFSYLDYYVTDQNGSTSINSLYDGTFQVHPGLDYGNGNPDWTMRVVVSICDGVVIQGREQAANGREVAGRLTQEGEYLSDVF
jgi:hypothetical protein